jgi:hypothetical protein
MHSIIHTNQQLLTSFIDQCVGERERASSKGTLLRLQGGILIICRVAGAPLPCDLLSLDRVRIWIPTLLPRNPLRQHHPPFAAQKRSWTKYFSLVARAYVVSQDWNGARARRNGGWISTIAQPPIVSGKKWSFIRKKKVIVRLVLV